MASTFILKRKTFADNVNVSVGQGGSNDGKKGSSFGKKLAIGVGTIGATAGTFALARRGKLGAGLQKSANNLYGQVGGFLSRKGATGIGSNMMKSAEEKYQQAAKDILEKNAKKNNITLAAGQADAGAAKAAKMRREQWGVGKSQWKSDYENSKSMASVLDSLG